MQQQFPQTPGENSTEECATKFITSLKLAGGLIVPALFVLALQKVSINHQLVAGDPVPKLSLQRINADPLSLVDSSRGKMALLFFSLDCPHCKREIKHLDQLAGMFNREIVFIAISSANAQKTQRFIDSTGTNVAVALDPQGTARRAFGVFEVPALFLVNAAGFVEGSFHGEQSLETRIQQLSSFARPAISPVRAPH